MSSITDALNALQTQSQNTMVNGMLSQSLAMQEQEKLTITDTIGNISSAKTKTGSNISAAYGQVGNMAVTNTSKLANNFATALGNVGGTS